MTRHKTCRYEYFAGLLACLLLTACTATEATVTVPTTTPQPSVYVTLVVDRQPRQIQTSARTVGDVLRQAGVTWDADDQVDPPPGTEMRSNADDEVATSVITLVRVSETTEKVPESLPYRRQIVRSSEQSPADPPRIVQTGVAGLQETTIRIVFHDGLEVERWPISSTMVEPPRDEIVMIGVGAGRDTARFRGQLAYVSDGRALILRGSTDAVTQLPVEGDLDGRVYQLSPDGRYLLYTIRPESVSTTSTESFHNELWVIETEATAVPRPLAVENVLWAGWDPSATESSRIAYTTARSVTQPPGWEANNDLWVMSLSPSLQEQPAPVRLISSYPAAYSWWGGHYAWSPTGATLAYAYADEVGVLDMSAAGAMADGLSTPIEPAREVLVEFSEYNTGADWAWVPVIAWSTDGLALAHTTHAGDDTDAADDFDLWRVDVDVANRVLLDDSAGMWTQIAWSDSGADATRISFLRPSDPATSQDSLYTLWLANSDGSGAQRLFPPEDETGQFSRSASTILWEPGGSQIAFIFDNTLHILDTESGAVFRQSADDSTDSLLTWAPYGLATSNP